MKPRLSSLPTLRKALMLLSLASLFLLATTTPLLRTPIIRGYAASVKASPFTTLWHAGNFRYLDSMSGDLITFVQGLQHPNSGGYGKLSSTRKANFNAYQDALFAAIDASIADGDTGDWCGVKSKAGAAGYAIYRFYDTASGRWFIYSYDTTSFGQAYFFINPFAKRNIVIEVPHEDSEPDTGKQGALLFKALAARALIVNKEHRCSDPDTSACAIGLTTAVCDGRYRESDVAHHTANTFYLLHVRYTDMDSTTKFVQLHGFSPTASDVVEIGDASNRDLYSGSASVIFANNLRKYVPASAAVHSCQQYAGDPPSGLCGETNVEGRYTNQSSTDACPPGTSNSSGRFLHVEQGPTLRDENDGDGWYWGDIRDALLDTWPDCNMNNGASDCTLGSVQTQYSTLTCP